MVQNNIKYIQQENVMFNVLYPDHYILFQKKKGSTVLGTSRHEHNRIEVNYFESKVKQHK